jgi:hypothetical protein
MINKIVTERELQHQFTAQLPIANKQLTGIFRDFSDGPKGLQRTKTKKNVFGFFNGIGNFG